MQGEVGTKFPFLARSVAALNAVAIWVMGASILTHGLLFFAVIPASPYMGMINGLMILGCGMCVGQSLRRPCPRTWKMAISMGNVMLFTHWIFMQTGGAASDKASASHHGNSVHDHEELHGVSPDYLDLLHSAALLTILGAILLHFVLLLFHSVYLRSQKADSLVVLRKVRRGDPVPSLRASTNGMPASAASLSDLDTPSDHHSRQ